MKIIKFPTYDQSKTANLNKTITNKYCYSKTFINNLVFFLQKSGEMRILWIDSWSQYYHDTESWKRPYKNFNTIFKYIYIYSCHEMPIESYKISSMIGIRIYIPKGISQALKDD